MKRQKLIIVIYYVAFLAALITLIVLSKENHTILSNADSYSVVVDEFNSQQKDTALANVIAFSILTIIGLWLFKTYKKVNYIAFSLVLYVAVTLFNFFTLNKQLFALKDGIPSDHGAYWLMTFIGIFYIIGAVVVAAIGYITVKNYTKRKE